MKIMVASDIHGSALFAKALVEAFKREGADKLLLLGDLLYHGPRNDLPEGHDPKGVIDLLSPLAPATIAVRGNCDSEVDQLMFPFPMMADYGWLMLGGRTIYATHGHLAKPPMQKGDVMLSGHTHIPLCEERDGVLYANPGSVSIPKANSPHSYMLLTEEGMTWKTLEGTPYQTYSFSSFEV